MPLRDALYEAAGVAIPSAPPIGAQTSATEIHPRPWTIDPIDAGDVTKYEINDANNFVVCLIDDEVVAQFIVDRINSDRKSVVSGKSVAERVDYGGRRII